ncbi:hypothetical protein J3Q64DRAFT_1747480 [Phycomyces blakesleeanus]|uniref:Uncharacterized protein n=1 Tax=Phycomyces blakesleeanus TaxID=4837 RepID=A0ABR3AYE6_PHYBL
MSEQINSVFFLHSVICLVLSTIYPLLVCWHQTYPLKSSRKLRILYQRIISFLVFSLARHGDIRFKNRFWRISKSVPWIHLITYVLL